MRYIQKGTEPNVLTVYKAQGGTQYEGGNLDKTEIQLQLLKEQKGLCAYCMARISFVPGHTPKMIIEHRCCRELHKELELKYSNMLGVCLGNSDNRKAEPRCDKSKDSNKHHYELKKLIPTNQNVETLFHFLPNGQMIAKNNDPEVQQDIEALNLNEYYSRINRENILQKLITGYRKVRKTANPALVKNFLNKELNKWNALNNKGYLQPYCLVATKFIQSKLGSN